MKKINLFKSLLLVATAFTVVSCSTDEPDTNPGTDTDTEEEAEPTATSYVVAVTSTSSSDGGADYLLYTSELGSEDLSILGSGVESDLSNAQWYFVNDTRVFGLKYSDGDPTPAESYVMGEQKPVYGLDYTSYRFTTYGTWGDNMVTSSSNSYTTEETTVFEPYYNTMVYPRYMYIGKYHATNGEFSGEAFESDNYLGTGEYCSMAGFTESNGWLYATVYSMGVTAYASVQYESDLKATSLSYYGDESAYLDYVASAYGGSNSGSFKPGEIPSTPFADQFHIAVFKDEADFPYSPIIISDDRMSPPCGRSGSAQYPAIAADDNGDVYIFSPGNERSYNPAVNTANSLGSQLRDISSSSDATDENYVQHMDLNGNVIGDGYYYYPYGTHATSAMRIKKGETKMDESYGVFDVETAMGGRSFLSCQFIKGSGSKYLILAYEPGVIRGVNTTGTASSTKAYTYYVVDAEAKTATKVSGTPAEDTMSAVARNPYSEDGKAYVGITSSENSNPAIYEIDSATGVAKKVMEVECYGIQSIGKLSKY